MKIQNEEMNFATTIITNSNDIMTKKNIMQQQQLETTLSSKFHHLKQAPFVTNISKKRGRRRRIDKKNSTIMNFSTSNYNSTSKMLLINTPIICQTTRGRGNKRTKLSTGEQQQTTKLNKCIMLAISLQIAIIASVAAQNATNTTIITATTTAKATTITTNNNSDVKLSDPPLVAKAEALISPSSHSSSQNNPVVGVPSSQSSTSQQQQSSATILSATNSKLFEACKLQMRTGLQLTNLSQIMFQPSEICSNWQKMIRSPTPQSSSSNQADEQTINSYPWYYIEMLNLSFNNLTVLHDSSGISKLVNLLELRITHNQLTRCEEASLLNLQRLQHLDLSHNRLMALPTKFFQPVKMTLKKLNLSFNSISVLVPTLFDSLNQLEYLDLSHNDITSHWINDRLFKNLTQLHYLDLSFNKLTVFSSPMTFSSLQQLETLSLQHNELRQVPETIQYLRYLSSLDLSQNFIHDITNASYLSNCRLLFNLNLESNLLENITRDAFSDLPALKVLNLANNRIHLLDHQAFDCKYAYTLYL